MKYSEWENQHNLKKSGILYVKRPNLDWQAYPQFSEGKQDYWSGFAIDFLISQEMPNFVDRGGHETGVDHTLDFTDHIPKVEDIMLSSKEKTGAHNFFSKLRKLIFK